MEIKEIAIEDIVPYENNPRKNRKTIDKLKELISNKEVEFNVPILLDKKNVIIKGHSRYHALKELGYDTIPCIYSNNSDELNNEDRIMDNVIQELSSWKEEELSFEIRDTDINPTDYNFNFRDIGYQDTHVPIITDRDIEVAEQSFIDKAAQTKKDFIDLTCEHCGCEFMVERNEVNRFD